MSVYLRVGYLLVSVDPEEAWGVRSTGARVLWDCEPGTLGPRSWPWVTCRSSKHSNVPKSTFSCWMIQSYIVERDAQRRETLTALSEDLPTGVFRTFDNFPWNPPILFCLLVLRGLPCPTSFIFMYVWCSFISLSCSLLQKDCGCLCSDLLYPRFSCADWLCSLPLLLFFLEPFEFVSLDSPLPHPQVHFLLFVLTAVLSPDEVMPPLPHVDHIIVSGNWILPHLISYFQSHLATLKCPLSLFFFLIFFLDV